MLWLIERRASASGFATSKVPNHVRKEPNAKREGENQRNQGLCYDILPDDALNGTVCLELELD